LNYLLSIIFKHSFEVFTCYQILLALVICRTLIFLSFLILNYTLINNKMINKGTIGIQKIYEEKKHVN